MPGTLYLCATPIGNLEDISARVLRVLSEVDLIAAEDTRNSIKLLNHFDIHTPMTAYHDHNRFEKAEELVAELLAGKNIALITDAGTPGISDPGEEFVRAAVEAGVPVTALPGPVAAITALILSGLPTGRFCFEGFLPRENKERRERLAALAKETRTMLFHEAPGRVEATLADLAESFGPDRRVAICRELTKVHEEVIRGRLREFANRPLLQKGEFVLVVEGADEKALRSEEQERFRALPLAEHMELYLSEGLDEKEAMKRVAKDRGVPKREIYAQWKA